MTYTDSIINEHLLTGRGQESLRDIAETIGQPLRDEVLAVMAEHAAEEVEATAEAAEPAQPAAAEDSGPCDTAAYPVAHDDEEAVFFIAADEDAVSGEGAVDFDVLAGCAAASESSVAEILVDSGRAAPRHDSAPGSGQSAAAENAATTEPAPEGNGEAIGDIGIWSKLWSKVSGKNAPVPALAPAGGVMTREHAMPSPLFGVESTHRALMEPVVADFPAAASTVPEEEDAVAGALEELDAEAAPVQPEEEAPVPAQSETSVDYIPAGVSEQFDLPPAAAEETQEPENAAALIRRDMLLLEAARAALPAAPAEMTPPPAATAEAEAAGEAAGGKISRRERRRREREEKKQQKRAARTAGKDMAEIVMTRSAAPAPAAGGTDVREFVMATADEAANAPAEDEERAEEGVDNAVQPRLPAPSDETAERPRHSHAVNLITPLDVVEEADESFEHRLVLLSSSDAATDESDAGTDEAAFGNNVILFRENFPVFSGIACDDGDDEESSVFLNILPPPESAADEDAGGESLPAASPENEETAVATTAAVAAGGTLDDAARSALARALAGGPVPEDSDAAPADEAGDSHVIVSMEEEEDAEELLAREARLRAEMAEEYQTRLDDIAGKILVAEARAGALETLVRDKTAETEERDGVIRSLRQRLDDEAAGSRKTSEELQDAMTRVSDREVELAGLAGLRDEHERLYQEFEDLRSAYNEVVTDVLPGLQDERDGLVLTVERQTEGEAALRQSIGGMRKRLAVGYSLGAAACLTLISLPAFNWLKSGEADKELALERQKISELRETLQRESMRNVEAQNVIVELENKIGVARAQIGDLQGKNQELARVQLRAPRHDGGLAVFPPAEAASAGVPIRASDMALQATAQSDGRLHRNAVRDPAGSIEQVMAMNRAAQQAPGREEALARRQEPAAPGRPIAISAVARVDEGRAARQTGSSLRPGAAMSAVAASRPAERTPRTAAAGGGEVLATVKKGEGVAQVVYRELGTWDPEVVAWVIRQNKIPMDRRGNPRIYPDQTLRLPRDGNIVQTASIR